MNKPQISVVIPTYNHAAFLKRALMSVIKQEFISWEIIIVDNHSSDNTDEVVKSFNESRIKLFKIHNNGVIGASRNYGMKEAKGNWIAFMDSDDIWYETKLSSCEEFFKSENHKFDVISNDELMVFSNSKKNKILNHGPASKNIYRDMIIYGNRLSPSAAMVRKCFLEKHEITFSESKEFITAEDYDFWLNLALYKASFFFLGSVQGEYTIHGNNASSQLDIQASASKLVLMKHVFELQCFEQNKSRLWSKVKSRLYFSDSVKRIKVFHFSKAFILLLKSVLSSPLGLFEIILKKTIFKNHTL